MFKRTTLSFVYIFTLLCIGIFSSPLVSLAQAGKQAIKTIVIDAGHGGNDPGAIGEYSNEAQLTLQMALKLGKKLQDVIPGVNIVYTRTNENLPGDVNNKNEANRLRAKIANEARGDLFVSIHVNSLAPKYRNVPNGTRKETYYVTTGKGKKKKRVAKTRTVTAYKRVRIPETVTGTETYIWAVGKNDQKKQFVQDESGEQADSSFQFFDTPEAYIKASLLTAKYFKNSQLAAELVEEEFATLGRPSYGVKQRNHQGIWVLQATAMPSILVETGFICTPEDEAYLNSEKGQDQLTESMKNAILKYKAALESGTIKGVQSQGK